MAKDARPRDMIRRAQGLAQRLWSRTAVGLLCAATAVLFAGPAAAQGPTVEKIVKRGQFLCSGATVNSPGFAAVDACGHWKGMDVEICRALTVAILGDETKLSLVPVSFVQRFPALQSGDIDVIAKNTAWNLPAPLISVCNSHGRITTLGSGSSFTRASASPKVPI